MTADYITGFVCFYIVIAVAVSIRYALELERRLKERLPDTRPFRWGFYIGCSYLACAPFALLFAWALFIAAVNNQPERVGDSRERRVQADLGIGIELKRKKEIGRRTRLELRHKFHGGTLALIAAA